MTLSNGNTNGITAIGDDGLGQQPWWVEQWMELINGYRFKKKVGAGLGLRPRRPCDLDPLRRPPRACPRPGHR